LAFAAGAMLFVIAHEIIPESQNDNGHSKLATHSLMVGFVIMMFLDVVLG
jgi:ZIP family zinc transporter